MAASGRTRLDQALVARGYFSSRARARDAVERGCVVVDGQVARKPGQLISSDDPVSVDDPASRYVARSALKLSAALDAFGVDPAGRHALDVGQSTGGFTQVLLERGAAHVTGVDVGHGQVHPSLQDHQQITILEGINARHADQMPVGPFDLAVIDVSFISLRLILPVVASRLKRGGPAVALFKPQFEVGRSSVGSGGIVTQPDAVDEALDGLERAVPQLGLRWHASIRSPLPGADGNVERLVHLVRL
ncbi:MAG: TlyA family RNA methyltransferase [Pseudomonadota bacterium]